LQNNLSQLFAQWEHNPPIISGTHAKGKLKEVFSLGQSLGFLSEEPSASSIDCPDCSRRCRVDYLQDPSGSQQAFIHCRDCGLSKLSREQLQRWSIQTERVLSSVFAGVTLSLAAKVAPYVWHVGKATWAGRSRQIWFARGFQREGCQAAVCLLRANSKAVVFTPTDRGAGLWQEATGNLVIPLDLDTFLDSGTLMLDVEDIQARIEDAIVVETGKRTPTKTKRSQRAANIESLTRVVIEFLRSARDYAFDTKEKNGVAELLPRPAISIFCKQAGIRPHDFSRCLDDESARELKVYWGMTENLEQIMSFRKKAGRRRKPTKDRAAELPAGYRG
jgi:hypothetical protein